MKKLIIIALFAAFPFVLNAQESGFDKLIKKYDGKKGITAVNLEGNILEGITYFLSQFDTNDAPETAWYDETEEETVPAAVEMDEEIVVVEVQEEAAIAEPAAEESEYEFIYGETGDYDYSGDDDYYSDYTAYSGYSQYLEMFRPFFEGLTYVKAIVYENASKKFAKDIQKTVVAKKPYKSVVSMNIDGENIRLYMIDDEAAGQCEILAIVISGNECIALNILGSRDFKNVLDILKQFM